MKQPDFILRLNTTLSKEDSDSIQEALNRAYTLGYEAHMKQVCKHTFISGVVKKDHICSMCGISFEEYHISKEIDKK